MYYGKKTHKSPFYKKLLATKYNLLNNPKIFNFKKKKWRRFQFFSKVKLRFFKRYRFFDQSKVFVSKFKSPGNAYKKSFKNYMVRAQSLRLMYGGFKKKQFKRLVLKSFTNRGRCCNKNLQSDSTKTLVNFEKRLDSVLIRSFFCSTALQARQFIKHGHITVNKTLVTTPHFKLRNGDNVSVTQTSKIRNQVKSSINKSRFWPLPPSFLKINYKTLTILVVLSNTTGFEKLFFKYNLKVDTIKNLVKFR